MTHAPTIGLLLCAALAWGQNALPELAPFPLEIIRTSAEFTRQDREDLQKLFPMMIRAADVAVPGSARLSTALVELRRQDCDRDDACLAQLAKRAASLYGLYSQLDLDLDGNVIASGRVVRDDGKPVRGPRTVKLARGARPFKEVAQLALKQLLAELDVAGLSPVRPAEQVEVKPVPSAEQVPQTITTTTRPLSALALGSAGVGAVSMVVGTIFFASAGTVRTDVSQGVVRVLNEDADKVAAIQRAQGTGVVLLAVGGALVAGGVGLYFLGPETTTTTLVPINGGAVVLMSGRLP